MHTLLSNITKWGVFAHLTGLCMTLVYGFSLGDTLAPFQEGVLSVIYHPVAIGLSIGMTGTPKIAFDKKQDFAGSSAVLADDDDNDYRNRELEEEFHERIVLREQSSITGLDCY